MFSKLLRRDLKRNMRWMWIMFVATIVLAGVCRGCSALGKNIMFFKILAIFFDSVFYALAVNVILQPFLRNFMNFSKSLYGDESYLTHTLPVTKKQLIDSKFLTALIETSLSFVTLVVAILARYATPTMMTTLKMLLSTAIVGEFSVILVLTVIVLLVFVEFVMFLSIIFFSMVLAYRAREKKGLKTFLLTAAFAFASSTVLSIVLVVILVANNVNLASTTLVLSSGTMLSVVIAGTVVYSLISTLFYLLTRREFSKGVNVD